MPPTPVSIDGIDLRNFAGWRLSNDGNILERLSSNHLQLLYRIYAPVYDFCLRRLFRDGHSKGIACLPKGRRLAVLDVGIGTGLSLEHYGSDHEVTGIDSSTAMLAIAHRKKKLSLAAAVNLVEMDASRLEFSDSSFDAVLLCYVLSVVPSPTTVVDEAIRVTKPGGDIIVVNHSRSAKGSIAGFEKTCAPLARLLGFQSDISIADCFATATGLGITGERGANAFGYWKVFHCNKHEG